ncbi:MAG: ribonuclease domain-containing protein [Eubacteriaceae bacterium]
MKRKIISLFIVFSMLLILVGCTTTELAGTKDSSVKKGQEYSSKEEVAAYINLYGELPRNYITKKKAMEKGWDNKKGNLWEVTDKMSIGGDKYGNREKILPDKEGRQWYECDINYQGGYRGAERILYSNDGLIFYSDDHYQSAVQLV